jgi:hypothetical protein
MNARNERPISVTRKSGGFSAWIHNQHADLEVLTQQSELVAAPDELADFEARTFKQWDSEPQCCADRDRSATEGPHRLESAELNRAHEEGEHRDAEQPEDARRRDDAAPPNDHEEPARRGERRLREMRYGRLGKL